ncbi:MAG: histidine phosphatase family protein [Paracoccaceae bacterium]
MSTISLAFIRHAKVPSHKGDMPLTEDSMSDINAAVPKLKALGVDGARYLFLGTQTKRSRQTADALRAAIDPASPEVQPAFALRNPDIHLAGSRVEMGSTPEFFASQCEHLAMTPEAVLQHPFYAGFLNAPDRIEYWVHHTSPPGEDAASVAHRIIEFAKSFRAAPDVGSGGRDLVVACVTHSPVMRAILTQGLGLKDPGEPDWVEAIVLQLNEDGITYRFRDSQGTVQ